MRTSKKEHVLQSAMAIVEKQGLAALTYESLAAESGLSKSGLIYYFPSGKHYCSKSTGFWPHNGKKKWWN